MVLSIIGNLIGNIFGSDNPNCINDDLVSPCFRPGVLLDVGISWVMNLRRFFIAGIAVGGVEGVKSTKCDQVCRASELPIYMDDNEARKRQAELCPTKPGLIENAFGSVRRQVWSIFDGFKVYQSQAEDFMNDSTAKANSWLTFFSEEADETTRMGAIGVGAISGYILGMRGGFFKRIFYSGLVSGAMTAICYPKQTAEYSREAISSAQKGATIGYNFIFGVKPDDNLLPELPKLPSSFSEVWEMAASLGKSASSLVTDQFEKFERSPSSEKIKIEKQE